MAAYYPSTCNPVNQHNCDPCETQELGRIRSAFFVSNSFTFTDETDPTEWAAGIASGDIFIIPETHGDFSAPSPKFGAGFGDTVEQLLAYDFTAKYFDPNFASNCEWYNTIKKNRNFKFGWRTSSKCYISTKTVVIVPMYEVQDDLTSLVTWNTQIKWQAADLPCPFDTPEGIFDECYIP